MSGDHEDEHEPATAEDRDEPDLVEPDPDAVDPDEPEPDAVDPDAVEPDEPAPVSEAPAAARRRRRVPRWDRPPDPHDWRWVVGGIGRVLISVGLLMFAFVAYQLWGTGIQTARAQNRLEDRFTEMLEAATTLPPPTSAVPTTQPAEDPATTEPATSPSSTSSTSSTTTTLAPPAVLERPAESEPVGRLEIPSIGLDKYAVEGVSVAALRDGPGHFPETPFPGQLGNAAIAGHRTTYGQPFFDLDKVEIGDDIIVTTLAGRYTYVVTGTVVVLPGDYAAVIPTIDPEVATLTLTTCHPAYSTTKRLVVTATLDPARSSIATMPTPPDGVDATGTIPGDEPETTGPVATDPPASEAASDATDTTDTADITDITGTTVAAAAVPTTTVVAPTTTIPEDSQAAFGGGWFDDPDAWPQVALWGLVLAVVALGAYGLSRRVRRNWVGALAGIVPFVVALYFWFENVNRLLPPNL